LSIILEHPLITSPETGNQGFRPVQDLQAVNSATVTLHPIVPNPYMILGLVPAEAKFFLLAYILKMILHPPGPKEPAYFCLPMGKSQYWGRGQLAWTWLTQGFKISPTIFRTALASDLKAFSADQHGWTLLQYVNDLLLAGPTWEDCMEGTMLSLLLEAGYKVCRKRAQICQNTVIYIDFHLSQWSCRLFPERKQALCSIPVPKICQQIRVLGSCRLLPNLDS
jgi:hypothetical protein